jgi:hypothetical protein
MAIAIAPQPNNGMPEAHISETMSGEDTPLTENLEKAFQNAVQRKGKLPQPILDMQGMSGKLYRTFINNLIEYLPDARYLEVGSWAGSTMCSAIFGNALRAFAIDNWSEFGGPSNVFLQHVGACTSKEVEFNMLTQDFRSVKYNTIGKFNVYLFDGPHEEQDQYDGLYMAMDALDEEFVFIVDDWNWDRVRDGTFKAIKKVGAEIIQSYEVRTSLDGNNPTIWMEKSDWHNGYFISVLRKPKK